MISVKFENIWYILYLIAFDFLSPRNSNGGYSNRGCPSVTLSCLRDNLSKHRWI